MIAIWNYAECSVGTLNAEGLIAENRDYWNMAERLPRSASHRRSQIQRPCNGGEPK